MTIKGFVTSGEVREANGHPPTQPLALAGQLGGALQRGLRATHPSNDLTTQPRPGATTDPVEKPDSPAVSSRPHGNDRIRMAPTHLRILGRWIQAEGKGKKEHLKGLPPACAA